MSLAEVPELWVPVLGLVALNGAKKFQGIHMLLWCGPGQASTMRRRWHLQSRNVRPSCLLTAKWEIASQCCQHEICAAIVHAHELHVAQLTCGRHNALVDFHNLALLLDMHQFLHKRDRGPADQ